MRKEVAWGVVLAFAVGAVVAARVSAEGEVPAGQAIFVSEGCDTCHAVPAAGIEAKLASPKINAPALPNPDMGSDEWLAGFLRQETKKKEAVHLKKFTGSDEEMATLLAWLRGLTSAAP